MTETPSITMKALAPVDSRLPLATVQGEWDQTLHRLREVCDVDALELVSASQYARVTVRLKEGTTVEQVEHILFDNLLLALWTRTEHDGTIAFGREWLWHWRKSVPWRSEKVGGMSRLVPDAPRHQWTYRFNVIEVDN